MSQPTITHLTPSVPGDDLKGVFRAGDFLSLSDSGELSDRFFDGDDVLVFGSGPDALDSARTASRLAARSVTVLTVEGESDLQESETEIEETREMGISFEHGWAPAHILDQRGHVRAVTLTRDPALEGGETREVATTVVILSGAPNSSCEIQPGDSGARRRELETQGWEYRGTFDDPRLEEIVEMYEETGFQVHQEPFDPEQESGCVACMRLEAHRYRDVYVKQNQ